MKYEEQSKTVDFYLNIFYTNCKMTLNLYIDVIKVAQKFLRTFTQSNEIQCFAG